MTERWQRLVTCAEERHKLVTASLNFYKTAEQVCSVLDSLEREYRRDEDWCGSAAAPGDELAQLNVVDKAAQVSYHKLEAVPSWAYAINFLESDFLRPIQSSTLLLNVMTYVYVKRTMIVRFKNDSF